MTNCIEMFTVKHKNNNVKVGEGHQPGVALGHVQQERDPGRAPDRDAAVPVVACVARHTNSQAVQSASERSSKTC